MFPILPLDHTCLHPLDIVSRHYVQVQPKPLARRSTSTWATHSQDFGKFDFIDLLLILQDLSQMMEIHTGTGP